jgi:hypothetical protein
MDWWVAVWAYLVTGLFVWFAMMLLKYQKNQDVISDFLYKYAHDRPRSQDASPGATFLWATLGWGAMLGMTAIVFTLYVAVSALRSICGWPERLIARYLVSVPEPEVKEPEPIVHEIGSFRDGPIYVEDRPDGL